MIMFKRGPNPGKGKEYEINLISLMGLRLFLSDAEDFDDFDLGFNLKNMGKFDDLVIVLKKNDKSYKNIAVQLKHKEDQKQLTVDMLNADTGEYSLVAYAESTKHIIEQCHHFILFSNISFDSKKREMEEFQIKQDEDKTLSFLNTSIQSPDNKFKFEPKANSKYPKFEKMLQSKDKKKENKMEKELMNKLYLMKNEFKNTSEIKEEFQGNEDSQTFTDKCEIFKEFYGKYLRYLDKKEISQMKKQHNTTYLEKCVLFDKFFGKFSLSPNQKNKQQVKQMVQEEFEKMYSAPNSTEEYIHLISAWYDEEIIKDVTYSQPKLNKVRIGKLLVICLLNQFVVNVQPDNDEHENQWNVFKTVARQFLVSEVDAEIVKGWASPLNKKNYGIWRNDSTEPIIVKIDDIKHSKQVVEAIKIMKTIKLNQKLIIIGKLENSVENAGDKFTNLFEVQDTLSPDDFNGIIDAFHIPLDLGLMEKDYILKTITPSVLFNLIDKPKQDLETLPECYISRTMEVPCYAFNQIRNILKNNVVILKTEEKPDDLKMEMQSLKTRIFTMDEFLNNISKQPALVLTTTKNYKNDLQLFNEKYTKKNVYVFNHYPTTTKENFINSAQFDLIWSYNSSIELLTNPPIKRLKDEDVPQQCNSRINILCEEPGMGKTSCMKFLHNKFVSENYYSKLIFFKDHVKFFKDYEHNEPTIESILKYFLNIDNHSLLSLQIQCYLIRNRCCLFFDGLDELDTKYVNNAINCIQKILGSPQIHKIFVSARKHLKHLKTEFNVNIIEMSRIDRKEQEKYIADRLKQYDNSKIEEILATISTNFDFIQENDKLLGIPLQLYIITEVLIFDSNESVKELLVLSKLYDKFINGKFEHLQTKSIKNKNINNLYDLNKHEMFALKVCLDSNDFSRLITSENYDNAVKGFKESCGLQVGIVLNFTEENLALFAHQTIPEYLCASYFVKNFKKIPDFNEFILNSRYDTIRYFMDMKLAENSELHLAVLYRQHDLILKANVQDIRRGRDAVNRNLLQLSICYYRQEYPELKRIEGKENAYEEPKAVNAASESTKLFKHLCDHCNLTQEEDELFHWSSAEYAISLNNLPAIDSILHNNMINEKLLNFFLKINFRIQFRKWF